MNSMSSYETAIFSVLASLVFLHKADWLTAEKSAAVFMAYDSRGEQ